MNNTFWTIINENYYRIKDNELYIAPILNDEVDTNNSSKVLAIDTDVLELINLQFNSDFEFGQS